MIKLRDNATGEIIPENLEKMLIYIYDKNQLIFWIVIAICVVTLFVCTVIIPTALGVCIQLIQKIFKKKTDINLLDLFREVSDMLLNRDIATNKAVEFTGIKRVSDPDEGKDKLIFQKDNDTVYKSHIDYINNKIEYEKKELELNELKHRVKKAKKKKSSNLEEDG